jgi:phosphatidate cytidylyltransferase
MLPRLLSTVALWALVFAVVGWGGVFGALLLLAVATALSQHEFHGLLEKCGLPPWRLPSLALGIALVLGAAWCPFGRVDSIWLAAALALVLGAFPAARDPNVPRRLAGSVLAIAYVPFLLQYFAFILRDFGPDCPRGDGLGLIVWTIAVAKFTDVGGYLVGSICGRHKLAPAISPGKTWEGVAGGLALAAGVGGLAAYLYPQYLPGWLQPGTAALLALPIAIAAIVSDLSESALKRAAKLKDSGRCIPGIGGALDLMDSFLLAAPVAYYLFAWRAR